MVFGAQELESHPYSRHSEFLAMFRYNIVAKAARWALQTAPGVTSTSGSQAVAWAGRPQAGANLALQQVGAVGVPWGLGCWCRGRGGCPSHISG